MSKNITVLGDPCIDWLIYDDAYKPPLNTEKHYRNWENSGNTCIQKELGGVMLLTRFIKDAMPGIHLKTYDLNEEDHFADLINSFAEIGNFKEGAEKNKNDFYRVARFKGFCNIKTEKEKLSKHYDIENESFNDTDLVVLDDVGNDFRKRPNEWIQTLPKNEKKPFILHKINWPLMNNDLIGMIDKEMAAQHIIVINASDLRHNGVQISSKLSWDKTIEDFIKCYETDARLRPFKKCKYLIVRFGLEGTVLITNLSTGSANKYAMKLLYFPNKFEGENQSEIQGLMQGISSIFHTALIQELIKLADDNETDPSVLIERGVIRGMGAAIKCSQIGYRWDTYKKLFYPVAEYLVEWKSDIKPVVFDTYLNKFNRSISGVKPKFSLLSNQLSGTTDDFLLYGALELVKSGNVRGAMTSVPFIKFKAVTSADREEIESYRSIRALLEEYIKNTANTKPLSIAVFGPPGSGKSFSVKQIAGLFKDNFVPLEFNLTQFNSTDELWSAFQEVRDANLEGKIPLVFFDEFDTSIGTDELGWLKYFLAPMQDGKFREGEKIHPIGRAVFVFAGGTSYSYSEFESGISNEQRVAGENEPQAEKLKRQEDEKKFKKEMEARRKMLKVPDFLSRLRGFINIKGVNKQNSEDAVFMIRRALVLRHHLSEVKGITNKADNTVSIDPDLLRAFIKLPELKNGARSLEAIIGMCSLKDARTFSRSCLPADHLLQMHLDIKKFYEELDRFNEILPDREFAINYGKRAHADYETKNPSIGGWDSLSDHDKESNMEQGIDSVRKLAAFNYSIRLKTEDENRIKKFSPDEITKMAIMEHERWMIYKQNDEWTYGPVKNTAKKTNPTIVPWNELSDIDKKKDIDSILAIPRILDECGYEIQKLK